MYWKQERINKKFNHNRSNIDLLAFKYFNSCVLVIDGAHETERKQQNF
jgi:hypothetical protein